jgi:endoglucanase
MARRLESVGVGQARGFSLNISNYIRTNETIAYGTQLSRLLGGKYFVIDTSRNGNGPSTNREWCNPSGRALGDTPVLLNGSNFLDALLWAKFPGESDGQCNGGPSAGIWWPAYAEELYRNRNGN